MGTNRADEKNYYNANLDRILSKYITSKQYGAFVPIVKDVFQRRAYEFGFSDKHIESEVKNFIKRAKTIEFAPDTEFEKSTTMGVYKSSEKKIQLNETYYSFEFRDRDSLDVGEEMYETLTHEIYHAISDRANIGVETYDYIKREWNGVALNEVITETAANRAVFSRTNRDFEQGRSKTDGYSDITFVTNLMAASIGVTEKEFLRAGVQNRKELMNLFNSKFPSNSIAKTAKKEYFDKIESSLDVIYNLNYDKENKDMPKEIKSELRASALTTLYKSAYELALFQISHDKTHTQSEMADEASFRFLKMENILFDTSKYFRNKTYITGKEYQSMHDEIYRSRQLLGAKILQLEGKKDYSQMDRYAVYNNSYARRIMREDFSNGKKWSNMTMARLMAHEYDRFQDSEIEFWNTEPVPVAANEYVTEPVDIVETSQRVTEPVQVIDYEPTEPVDVVEYEATEPISVVSNSQRITEPVDVARVKRITEKVNTIRNPKESNKSLLDRFKQTVDIIITRFKNRKLAKLREAREDNSEYYANLVNNTTPKDSEIDKYRVNVNTLRVENISIGTEEREEDRNQDEER